MRVEVDVKIKFLTPAFIGGAEPGESSEFNEKALKGALRFWWRAFLSDPTWNNKKLLEEESKIFGGLDQKSSFSINIVERAESLNRNDFDITTFNGIKYLFYPKITRIDFHKQILKSKAYIEPGSNYTIKFTFFKDSTIEPVLKSLLFLEKFGGIGARSRRGAGSFKIVFFVDRYNGYFFCKAKRKQE